VLTVKIKFALCVSRSEPASVIVCEVSSFVVTLWALALGASLTGLTVSETVAAVESSAPSFALKVKLSSPLKFASGV
jgi:hypothetical protein